MAWSSLDSLFDENAVMSSTSVYAGDSPSVFTLLDVGDEEKGVDVEDEVDEEVASSVG